MKCLRSLTAILPFALAVCTAQAGLQIPYTPDADTLHLWHFNGPGGSVTTTDEVQTASITLTNVAQTNVPGSTISLGNASAFAQLGTAMHIVATNLTKGNTYAFATTFADGSTNAGFADTTPFRNVTTGAFTIEALVNMDADPTISGNGNWEIVCGDNNGNNGLSRGWQFRVQTPGLLNFNFITGGGGNYTAALPTSGLDNALPGQWYHVAVTYTGTSPTNSDPAGVLTFYWTLLDGGRTNATQINQITQATISTLGGTPVLGVGGSGRANNGIANNEGFKGLIDEVRISDVARHSNEMAFAIGGALTPPTFLKQPPTNSLVGFGKLLSLPALVSGSPAPSFRWQQNTGGGFTDVSGQTDSTLAISNATFAATGDYQLIAANSLSSKTSTVAHVVIGAAFSELFDTGVDSNGLVNATLNGTTDAHYQLVESADIGSLGPPTFIWDMSSYPMLANGGDFANVDGVSAWIGPNWNNGGAGYTSPQGGGGYLYQTTFLLDSVDLTQPITLTGLWWENTSGLDIQLNGKSTGIASGLVNSPNIAANFVITNGFVPGLNTLVFVTTNINPNGSYPENAVRVELTGIGQALPAGKPTFSNTNLPINQTVRDVNVTGAGSQASFAVAPVGRPPLTYQWYADGALVSGATNRTLTFLNPTTGGQGTNFSVVVSNDSGSITSRVAVLSIVDTDQPPVAVNLNLGTLTNTALNVDISMLVHGSTDPDNELISFVSADATSTNGAAIAQNGTFLNYTPVTDYVGHDEFHYVIQDVLGTQASGTIDITISPLQTPTITSTVHSGNTVVLSGSGGAPLTGFHVFSTTNLSIPLTNWSASGSGAFDSGGHFNFTAAIAAGVPQNFYIIETP